MPKNTFKQFLKTLYAYRPDPVAPAVEPAATPPATPATPPVTEPVNKDEPEPTGKTEAEKTADKLKKELDAANKKLADIKAAEDAKREEEEAKNRTAEENKRIAEERAAAAERRAAVAEFRADKGYTHPVFSFVNTANVTEGEEMEGAFENFKKIIEDYADNVLKAVPTPGGGTGNPAKTEPPVKPINRFEKYNLGQK